MTSTEFNIGMSLERNSSRVLQPPGGGHSNIFGEAEVKVNSPRPKYDQQNSSNLNFCMNTVDPNILVQQKKEVVEQPAKSADNSAAAATAAAAPQSNGDKNASAASNAAPKSGRVPPGGFSSGGFW